MSRIHRTRDHWGADILTVAEPCHPGELALLACLTEAAAVGPYVVVDRTDCRTAWSVTACSPRCLAVLIAAAFPDGVPVRARFRVISWDSGGYCSASPHCQVGSDRGA